MLVDISDNFIYRTPNLPIKNLQKLYDHDKNKSSKIEILKDLLQDDYFIRALKTASPDLYSNLERIEDKKQKDIDSIFNSVLKYYVRLCSRPTPFSLFSSVGLGRFSSSNIKDERIDKELRKEKVRVSNEWFKGLLNLLIDQDELFKETTLETNDFILNREDNIYLSYFSGFGGNNEKDFEELSLKKTPLLNYILEICQNEIKVIEIIDTLQKINKTISEEQIIKYLRKLAKKDILISNLKLSSSTTNAKEEYLNLFDSLFSTNNDLYMKIKGVFNQLNYLDTKGEFTKNEIDSLENSMRELYDTKDLVHIDSIQQACLELDGHLKKEIENYAKAMTILSSKTQTNNEALDFYLEKFIEVYGINNAVLVKSLLEDSEELGPPPTYSKPYGQLDYEFSRISKGLRTPDLLKKMYYDALLNNFSLKIEDYISDDEILDSHFSESFDLYLSLYKDVESGQHTFFSSGNNISPIAGRTAGRFLDCFPNKNKEIREEIYGYLTESSPNSKITNLVIDPIKSKALNVMTTENDLKYEMSISSKVNNSKTKIRLNDLYVYTDGTYFYFYSKEANSLIDFKYSHMVNHQFGMPNFYRLLIDLTLYKKSTLRAFDWGEMENHVVTPEVTYKNFVIRSKTWTMNWEEKHESLETYVESFIRKYKVSRFVKCVEFDNYILIDLDSPILKSILLKELKRKKTIVLVEAKELELKSMIKDSFDNDFVNEFVFWGGNPSHASSSSQLSKEYQSAPLTFYEHSNRNKHLGEGWVYAKFYNSPNKDNEVLKDFIDPLLVKNPGYYIRYNDPYPHIRVRIQVTDNLNEILLEINNTFQILRSKNLSKRLVYDQYTQEIERYGGISLIEKAEAFFHHNSLYVLNIINQFSLSGKNKDKKLTMNLAFLSLMKIIQDNLQEEIDFKWFETKYLLKKEYYSNYRIDYKNERKSRELFAAMPEATHSYFTELKPIAKNNSTYFDQIVSSIFHMHFNRFGIHGTDEEMLINFIYFNLKEEYFKKSNTLIEV